MGHFESRVWPVSRPPDQTLPLATQPKRRPVYHGTPRGVPGTFAVVLVKAPKSGIFAKIGNFGLPFSHPYFIFRESWKMTHFKLRVWPIPRPPGQTPPLVTQPKRHPYYHETPCGVPETFAVVLVKAPKSGIFAKIGNFGLPFSHPYFIFREMVSELSTSQTNRFSQCSATTKCSCNTPQSFPNSLFFHSKSVKTAQKYKSKNLGWAGIKTWPPDLHPFHFLLLPARIELATSGLWDPRAANCATGEIKF